MTSWRWRLTILAALATIATIYPITSLFVSTTWFSQAVVVIGLVAAVGVIARRLIRSRALVVLTQLVVVGWVVIARHAEDTLLMWLPTSTTWEVLGGYGAQALDTIQRYSAPAPLNEGVTFCLIVVVGLVAITTDAMAATWRAPAAAGLPLLTAYLITAANGNEALQLRYFIVPVALWLIMLHTTAQAQFGRWSTTSALARAADPDGPGALSPGREEDRRRREAAEHDQRARRALSASAAKVGAAGVLAALTLAAVVPHFAPRYLTEGLGQRPGGGSGSVGFNDTLDLTKSLNNTDETPVLRYTTTGPRTPLRVLATSHYTRGNWVAAGRGGAGAAPAPLPPESQRKDYVMTVTSNTIQAPRLAAPFPVVAVAMDGPWSIDPVTRDVRVNERPGSYRVTFADLSPAPPLLRESGRPSQDEIIGEDLDLPDTSRELLQDWSDELTQDATNPLDRAIAIQDHLRDTTAYTYSLDLGPQPRDDQGRPLEPMAAFQETRRGYCVQFASAMIFLARAQGIPARMAIGFLPGSATGSGNIVRASDAHAWPELYFEGFGWLRFEPTPGSRSGTPPPYTVVGDSSQGTGGGRAPSEDTETDTSTVTVTQPGDEEPTSELEDQSVLDRVGGMFTGRNLFLTLTVIFGLGAAILMPATMWVDRIRRRRRARTRQELIEAEWDELTAHLHDLGLEPPVGGTLRQWREHYIHEGHLDPDGAQAMRRVTATLERARYDRPERTSTEAAAHLHADIRALRHRISRTRSWTARLSSFFWPSRAVGIWRRLLRRVD